ncbi:hypothetical protein ABL78_8250 [Leptomonas seymouri]|uniref:Uncharacterized protein n=1 Tax=Leptomonas seymouri TaxID=5684 RepID=A0A0N0P2A8_LEPSE|nr:hypothetical protein ABL78_8250 [Leptomonas seymouri]|eukprot:KPI82736.1 hypothetical protein ABL78_8250 [Leptomonas seymouri]
MNGGGGYVPPEEGHEAKMGNGQECYYYYEMPDGSIGYITASECNQLYSPAENQGAEEMDLHPAGYVEPTYGQGMAYAPAQAEFATPLPVGNGSRNGSSGKGDVKHHCYSDAYGMHASQSAYGCDTVAASLSPAAPSRQVQQQQPAYSPQVAHVDSPGMQPPGADAMTTAPQPELPHETADGGWYDPPSSFEAMRKWSGSQKWSESLARSCWKDPWYCLGACVAPWCVVAAQRRLLLQDYKHYRCCAGICGRADNCECWAGAPRCGLFWEVLCCLPCACHANRYMLMQRYKLKKSCLDSAVLDLGCFCEPCHWCSECTCWFPESICDWLYVVMYPCMLTQSRRELDAHDVVTA